MTKKQTNWEEEFREKFKSYDPLRKEYIVAGGYEKVKQFIHEAIQNERSRIVEEFKKEVDRVVMMEGSAFGLYEAIKAIKHEEA